MPAETTLLAELATLADNVALTGQTETAFVLQKTGNVYPIFNIANISFTEYTTYADGSIYRDTWTAAELGRASTTSSITPATSGASVLDGMDDRANHVAPRPILSKRTQVNFLRIANDNFSLPGTLTSTSATISMASTTGVVPGQAVIGVGIPSGSTVLSVTANTSIVISNAATASGAVSLLFGTPLSMRFFWADRMDGLVDGPEM